MRLVTDNPAAKLQTCYGLSTIFRDFTVSYGNLDHLDMSRWSANSPHSDLRVGDKWQCL